MSLRLIDKYEVIATLGRGSMGVVYKAQDPEIGRLVAIKTLRSVFLGDDAQGNEALKRFRQESRSAGKLRHPNIVTIFEAGRTENGSPYIVMEFIEGSSLEQLIAQRAPLRPSEALHYLSQVASAIDYAHSQSVIHRDIKPSNVIVDIDYNPHLLDFGVAKLSDTSLTPAGTVVGTPSYMSPEQIRGEQLDGSADLFAFAVLAFETFTAHRPFPGKDFTTVVNNIIHREPLTFADVGVPLPPALEVVFHKALSKDKTGRYQSALEFVDKMASVFNIIVDGGGLVGGFRPEEDLQIPDTGALKTIIAESTVDLNGSAVVGAANGLGHSNTSNASAGVSSTAGSSQHSTGVGSSPERTPASNIPPQKAMPTGPRKATEGQPTQSEPAQAASVSSAGLPSRAPIIFAGAALVAVAGLYYLWHDYSGVDGGEDGGEFGSVDFVDSSEPGTSVTPSVVTASSLDIGNVSSSSVSSLSVATPASVMALSSEASLVASSLSSVASLSPPSSSSVSSSTPAVEILALESILPERVATLSELHLAYLLANPDRVSVDVLRAAIAQAKPKDDKNFTLLVGALALSGSSLVKVDALRVLGAPPHSLRPEAREVLKKALSDGDYLVRGFSAKALGRTGDRSLLPLLEERERMEEHSTVKQILAAAIQTLRAGGEGATQ